MQDGQYLVSKRSYDRQYANLYFARLTKAAPIMRERATSKWPSVESGYR